jgi:OOP family OmpA-OmpF porin
MKTALVLATLAPVLAGAQQPTRVGSWEFGLAGGGVMVPTNLMDFLSSGSPENRFTKDTDPSRFAPAAVARLGYNMGKHLGVAVSGEAAFGEGVKYYTPALTVILTGDIDAKFSPFLTMGAEVTRVEGQNDRVTHSTWGANAGVGFRAMMSDYMAFRADVQAKYGRYTEVPMDGEGTITPVATIGFTWFSGGRRTAPAGIPMYRVDTIRSFRTDTIRMASEPIRSVRVDTVALDMDQVILRVQFATDSSVLLPISYPVLNTVATALKATQGSTWAVEGHTDNVGPADYNMALSQARAQSVVDYLVSQGVSRSILTAKGYGLTRPVFSNDTVEGRAENRRVQLRRIPPAPIVPVR